MRIFRSARTRLAAVVFALTALAISALPVLADGGSGIFPHIPGL